MTIIQQTNFSPGPGSSEKHHQLIGEILLAIGSGNLGRFWRNETGAAYRGEKLIRYGVIGSPDIEGILPNGKYIGFEIKTGKAIQSIPQKNWQKMIEKNNGCYFVVRSVEEVKMALTNLNL